MIFQMSHNILVTSLGLPQPLALSYKHLFSETTDILISKRAGVHKKLWDFSYLQSLTLHST